MSDEGEAKAIRERLSEYYNEVEIEAWLKSPHPLLGGDTAMNYIDRGLQEQVHRIIDQLDAAVFL